MSKRVIFTGGSGKAGSWAIRELLPYGHRVLNLDLAKLDNPSVHTLKCDITDAGQVYSLSEPLEAGLPSPPNAIIPFAGISQPLFAPDNEVFRSNNMGFRNVLEGGCKSGVKKFILAGSVTTYGVSYAQGARKFPSSPIDEELDVNPTDPYALSKLIGEKVARSFAERFNVNIYSPCIGRVVGPDEYDEVFD
ncbi:NAD(P)-binding protein [Zopfia rhizophila CBS 207.26]|uniref:NAD(P)-binding protein n=1 Tax=Zopfia rhizophila CBS 207.26 TaxID=1314779 RepID=A0A6A6DWP9_9PEZI|nr:NAD(P)-binding protein [Zopfia rhizophila CBS 207.26]